MNYNIVNGTSYHTNTRSNIINILEQARTNHTHLHLYYGDTITGEDWHDQFGNTGYIGRSTGTYKIPLMIYNNRSTGGPGILDHCIVKIETTKGHKVLYQHTNYSK
jgi:hypothetical protein